MSYNCGSCGTNEGSGGGYSSLESMVSYSPAKNYNSPSSSYEASNISYLVTEAMPILEAPVQEYSDKKELYSNSYKSKPVTSTYTHVSDNFLALDRPRTVFIGNSNEIKEFVEEAFLAVTGKELPEDIMIRILSKQEFDKASQTLSGKVNNNLQGFAINRKKNNLLSEIFIKQGELDKVMLTLGHELGHVITDQLEDKRDEEAKAFAFSIAWMKKIKEFNIANLSTAIKLDKPARNGLHDIALDFVLNLIKDGSDALDIFMDVSNRLIEVNKDARSI